MGGAGGMTSRIAVGAVALLLFAGGLRTGGAVEASEVLRLVCSGEANLPDFNIPKLTIHARFIEVDFTNRTVKGGFPYEGALTPITKFDSDSISFGAPFLRGKDPVERIATGTINRLTGKLIYSWSKPDDPRTMLGSYDLTCHPARSFSKYRLP